MMEENQKKAFDFANDLTKQLITLATGIITLSVTFSKDIIGKGDNSYSYLMLSAWVLFILSILFGLLTMMALTGNLDPMPKRERKEGKIVETPVPPILKISTSNITGTSQLQVWIFFIAIIITVIYGFLAAKSRKSDKIESKGYPIVRKSILMADSSVHIDTIYIPKQ